MTRKNRRKISKSIDIIIIIVICAILVAFGIKLYHDYKIEKEDERAAAELNNLLNHDLTLFEEILPEATSGSITVLPPSNEDLLVANISYMGIIEIPKIGVRKAVVNGTTRKDIANKVGYETKSAKPGEKGNVVLAAHNAANYFGRIHKLQNGDKIYLTTRAGKFTYTVFDVFKVHKSETWVYKELKDHEKTITLITCVYPNDNYRWIVRGEQVEG